MPAPRRLLSAALLLAACGPSPAPTAPIAAPTAKPEVTDVCKGEPPVPHDLPGILRNARCEKEVLATMSSVGDALGVACAHCHASKLEAPKNPDYAAATKDKEIANWMSRHLMQAVKPADGSPLHCGSCHTDEHGRPVLKILGTPRDPAKVNEWMSLVMVRRFVAADGSKLRCRSCHVGTPGTAEFQPRVILQTGQIPKHAEGGKSTPSF